MNGSTAPLRSDSGQARRSPCPPSPLRPHVGRNWEHADLRVNLPTRDAEAFVEAVLNMLVISGSMLTVPARAIEELVDEHGLLEHEDVLHGVGVEAD